jgi:hypothetical protein
MHRSESSKSILLDVTCRIRREHRHKCVKKLRSELNPRRSITDTVGRVSSVEIVHDEVNVFDQHDKNLTASKPQRTLEQSVLEVSRRRIRIP